MFHTYNFKSLARPLLNCQTVQALYEKKAEIYIILSLIHCQM